MLNKSAEPVNRNRMKTAQIFILFLSLFGTVFAFDPFLSREVFEFPKLFILLIGIALLTILNLIDIYGFTNTQKLKEYFKKLKIELTFLSVYFVGHILSFTFSTDRGVSLIGSLFRYQGFLTQFYYTLFFLNTIYIFWKYKNIKIEIFLKFILIAACLIALSPYLFPAVFPFFYFTPAFFHDRVFGTFGNPNYLASFIIALLPMLIFTWKNTFTSVIVKMLKWPAAVTVVLITLFLTGSRSAWVAALVSFLFFGILKAIKEKSYKILIAVTVIIVLTGLSATVFKDDLIKIAPQFERFKLDTSKSNSIGTRTTLWRLGFELIPILPFTGFGQDMLNQNIDPYLPQNLKEDPAYFIDRMHSEALDILAMHGFLTFIGYFGFLLIIWIKALKFYLQNKNFSERLMAPLLGLTSLTLYHLMNFSSITGNILLFLLAVMVINEYSKKPDA